MIAQNIDIKSTQTLAMTPRLQQAIQLLQLSVAELDSYLHTQLEENPLLSRMDQDMDYISHDRGSSPDVDYNRDEDYLEGYGNGGGEGGDSLIFDNTRDGSYENMDYLETTQETTLIDYLIEQLVIFPDPRDRAIGEFLIYNLREDGFLEIDLSEVSIQFGVSLSHVESMLEKMQRFEPAGVFARDLTECFRLQLREQNALEPEMDRLLNNITLLTSHPMERVARAAQISVDTCQKLLTALRQLSPKPGHGFAQNKAQVLIPDILMYRDEEGFWTTRLNPQSLPKIVINSDYYHNLKNRLVQKEEISYVNERMTHAQWLVQALLQRADTMLRVSREIVRHQQAFFDHGYDYFKPLNLRQIAQAIEVHESTVSRITTSKFMTTPRGIFPMKFFFSASVSPLYENESISSKRIQEALRKLVREEPRGTPLSDDALMAQLEAQGLTVARRTINKYRKILGIGSSNERRRLYGLNTGS